MQVMKNHPRQPRLPGHSTGSFRSMENAPLHFDGDLCHPVGLHTVMSVRHRKWEAEEYQNVTTGVSNQFCES